MSGPQHRFAQDEHVRFPRDLVVPTYMLIFAGEQEHPKVDLATL